MRTGSVLVAWDHAPVMTSVMTELLAREHRRELLNAAARYHLGRASSGPDTPTPSAVPALVSLAKAVARRLGRIAVHARRSGEVEREGDRAGATTLNDRRDSVAQFERERVSQRGA
jgi:hypothetical protein